MEETENAEMRGIFKLRSTPSLPTCPLRFVAGLPVKLLARYALWRACPPCCVAGVAGEKGQGMSSRTAYTTSLLTASQIAKRANTTPPIDPITMAGSHLSSDSVLSGNSHG